MGIAIDILGDGEGVEIHAFGIVTGEEIIKARNKIKISHSIEKYKYFIINESQCIEYCVTSSDIVAFAELDIQAAILNTNIMIAIVESKYLQFSLAETWRAYVEEYISKIKSFRSRTSASNWIMDNLQ